LLFNCFYYLFCKLLFFFFVTGWWFWWQWTSNRLCTTTIREHGRTIFKYKLCSWSCWKGTKCIIRLICRAESNDATSNFRHEDSSAWFYGRTGPKNTDSRRKTTKIDYFKNHNNGAASKNYPSWLFLTLKGWRRSWNRWKHIIGKYHTNSFWILDNVHSSFRICTLEWPTHLNYVKFCLNLRFVFFL
jgi:hypothetical protein